MKNRDVDGSKPLLDGSELNDADDMSETAVLDRSVLAGSDSEIDEPQAPFDETVRLDKDSFLEETEAPLDRTVALDDSFSVTANVGDVSVEINVEELIANIETKDDKDAARKREIRRRLEEAVEDQAFEDTYAIDLDEQAD